MAYLLQALASTPHQQLLPHVRKIIWDIRRPETAMQLPLWVGPSLQVLRLSIKGQFTPMMPMMYSISQKVLPYLHELGLSTILPLSQDGLLALFSGVVSNPKLRSFSLSTLFSPGILDLLQNHRDLEYLDVHLVVKPPLAGVLAKIPQQFPVLQTFRVKLKYSDEGWHAGEVRFDVLRPLLQCRELKALIVDCDLPVTLDEDDVSAMASAWPHLHTLVFNCKQEAEFDSTVGTPVPILSALASSTLRSTVRHLALSLVFGQEIPLAHNHMEPFLCLQNLGLRAAIGEDLRAARLGEFLGVICPPGVEVWYEGAVEEVGIHITAPEDDDGVDIWRTEWKWVLTHMAAVQRARIGRDRYHASQEQRKQNAALQVQSLTV